MEGSENSGYKEDGQTSVPILKEVTKSRQAGNLLTQSSKSAHDDLVAESMIRDIFFDLVPMPNVSLNKITPPPRGSLENLEI